MSDSYRHTPIKKMANDKEWRHKANRSWRRAVHQLLHWLLFWVDEPLFPEQREVSDIWDAPSDDVKWYYGKLSKKDQDR